MPRGKEWYFDVVRTVLAMTEERGNVALDDAADAVGLSADELHRLLEPVLYLEFRTPDGNIVGEEEAFLLTENGTLQLSAGHWLRDLETEPPAPDAALRLLIAGITMQALATGPTAVLKDAVKKLRGVVAVELEVPVDRPRCLGTVQRAVAEGRSVRVRYLGESASRASEFEVLPFRAFCKWGHWYVHGRIAAEESPRYFRVDRMLGCEPGSTDFDPPEFDELPDWFDLSQWERTVRVRVTPQALGVLPQPHSAGEAVDIGHGQVEVDVTVAGDRRLEHLLVCLPPGAEVVSPEEYKVLRREHARRLLAAYE